MRLIRPLLAVVLTSATSCYHQLGEMLPKVDPVLLRERPKLQAIDYELRWQANGSEKAWGSAMGVLRERVDLMFAQSSAFENFSPGVGSEAYHLVITMNNHWSRPATTLSALLCGGTLLILPGYARDNYRLSIDVQLEGKVMSTYVYDDYKAAWYQILLVFGLPSARSGKEVTIEVFDNMNLHFVEDVKRDGMPAAPTESGAP